MTRDRATASSWQSVAGQGSRPDLEDEKELGSGGASEKESREDKDLSKERRRLLGAVRMPVDLPV